MTAHEYPPSSSPPPGWYPDASGWLRWWDGYQWGALAAPPPQSSESNAKTLATLSHLGCLFGSVLMPLIIYLVNGTKDGYIRHHAAEALNFQITFVIAYVSAFVLLFVGGIASRGIGFLVLFPVVFVAVIANLVLGITAAVKAFHGEWWRYPVSFRFVDGGRVGRGW